MKKYLILGLMILSPLGLYAQNAIIGSGFTDGWTTPTNNVYFSESAGTSRIGTLNAKDVGNQYFRFVTGWDFNDNTQWGPSNNLDTEISIGSKVSSIHSTTNGAWFTSVSSTSDWYIFKTSTSGNPPATLAFVVLKIEDEVRTLTSHTEPTIVLANQAVSLTLTTSGSSTGQGFYLRYTDDDFVTSTVVEMTGTETSYSATIPLSVNTASSEIQYYFFSSGSELTISGNDADLYSINLLNNSGSNYSYTVQSWVTAQDGDWNTASTWNANEVPSTTESLGAVTISHNVTLNQAALVSSLTIDAEKTLSASSSTLSIADDGTFTNNGTFAYETSTIHLLGDATVDGSSTTDFYNLIVDGEDDGPDYGAAFIPSSSTIYNKLTISNGGYLAEDGTGTGVSSSENLPNYGDNATLAIAGPFTVNSYASGWGDSGSKNPTNIEVGATGDVTLSSLSRIVEGTFTVVDNIFTADGNLTVKSGSEVFITSGSISGTLKFEQEVTGTEGWRLIGVPVSSTATFASILSNVWTQGLSDASTTAGSSNVLVYNGSAFESPTNLASNLEVGQGFAIKLYSDNNLDGNADDFPRVLNVTGSVASESVSPTLNQGLEVYTLVGNPHPSTIDYDLVTKESVSDIVYVYDSTLPAYISWNGTTGGLTDGLIAPFQGFFVYNLVAGPTTLTIPLSAKTTGGTHYKKVERTSFTLQAESNGLKSSTYFSFSETGLASKDALDAIKLSPLDHKNFLSLSSTNGSGLLDINNLPLDLQSSVEIPVHVDLYEANESNLTWNLIGGEILLKWDSPKNIPSSWTFELIDHENGNRVNLLSANEYAFSMNGNSTKMAFKNSLSPEKLSASSEARFTLIVGPVVTAISEQASLPSAIKLNQNYPNPFNPSTEISFELPKSMNVTLQVFDMLGREIATLVNGVKNAGLNTVVWNAADASTGIYFYRFQSASTVITKKMMLVK